MEIKETIINIEVQDPTKECFCSIDLNWTKYGSSERFDDVALIPYDRVDEFIQGESSLPQCPTQFHVEKPNKRSKAYVMSDKDDEYTECKLYWCSFGPENCRENGETPSIRRFRLNTRNRVARPESLRGCTCKFTVKRLYARPSVALIIYNDRRKHVDKSGCVCHGPRDKDAFRSGGKKIPYISDEIKEQTISMMYLGYPTELVLQKLNLRLQSYCGMSSHVREFASKFVQEIERTISRSTHELDLDDQKSIQTWVERNPKNIFFNPYTSGTDTFILGIQSEWQLRQMLQFGHHSLMAIDSTFGKRKLKYPLCTLLVFDSYHQAIPVAWVITQSFSKQDMSKWMKALVDRARSRANDSTWKISGFLIDDAVLEVDSIRDTFDCPVLFCPWRIRRSWLRNILNKCNNIEVRREIFKRLGQIMYNYLAGVHSTDSMSEFFQDFIDQTAFMQYFKASWLPRLEMWLSTMKKFPLASQEASGAIETYHLKLKHALHTDLHLSVIQRVDWLVHKLKTVLEASYILYRAGDENSSCQTVTENIAPTSWQRALQIPDSAVNFSDDIHLFAEIVSQRDPSQKHTVWNPGSEFAFCDCTWSTEGNFCKHVIKVNMVWQNHKSYNTSMPYHSFKKILVSLWQKPEDDSYALDQLTAWANNSFNEIQMLAKLHNCKDINSIVNNFEQKWIGKRGRTSVGMPSSTIAFPPNLKGRSKKAC